MARNGPMISGDNAPAAFVGFMMGATAGLVAGVVTGILFAPKSGAEMRQHLRNKAGDVKNWAGSQAQGAKDKASDVANRTRAAASAANDAARNSR